MLVAMRGALSVGVDRVCGTSVKVKDILADMMRRKVRLSRGQQQTNYYKMTRSRAGVRGKRQVRQESDESRARRQAALRTPRFAADPIIRHGYPS